MKFTLPCSRVRGCGAYVIRRRRTSFVVFVCVRVSARRVCQSISQRVFVCVERVVSSVCAAVCHVLRRAGGRAPASRLRACRAREACGVVGACVRGSACEFVYVACVRGSRCGFVCGRVGAAACGGVCGVCVRNVCVCVCVCVCDVCVCVCVCARTTLATDALMHVCRDAVWSGCAIAKLSDAFVPPLAKLLPARGV